jgi:DMSO/TMAO reductase YedYZ molybdopterin-dependent catalytic subunit
MRYIHRISLMLLAVACSLTLSASAQKVIPPSTTSEVLLTVGGKVDHPLSLTRADFDKFPRQAVKAQSRDGKEHKYEGVAVGDLLQKAGIEFGEALHQEAAATYLLAEATDGYQVVFALPEFDSPSIDRLILIADRQDGNPVAAASGPLQLIAPGDKGHGRWIRKVKSLTLIRAPAGAVARP